MVTSPPHAAPAAAPPSQPSRRRLFRVQEAGLVLVVILIGLALTFLTDPITLSDGTRVNRFLNFDNLVGNVGTYMAPIAIMAVGVTFVIIAGGIDISVGSIYGLSALGTAAVLQHFDPEASAWVVLPAAVAVPAGIGLVCGLLNGAIVVGLRMHPFIVTLGTLSIFRGIALVVVPSKSLPSSDRVLPPAFTSDFVKFTLDFGAVRVQPVPMLAMLLCVVAGWIYLSHTVGGRQIYAVGGNEEAARFSGVPVGRIKLRVYAISGLMAGLAGMVSVGYHAAASSATGEGYELIVIASAVVGGASLSGGRGTALGALLGALIIKLIDNGIMVLREVSVMGLFNVYFSKEYSKIIIGVAIIVAVAVDRVSEYLHRRRLAKRGASR